MTLMPLALEIGTIVFVPALVMYYLSWQMFGCRAFIEHDTPGLSKILLKDGAILACYISTFFCVFSPLSMDASYYILSFVAYEETQEPLIDLIISRIVMFVFEMCWTGVWGFLGYLTGKRGTGYR